MTSKINRSIRSPNYDPKSITVEFVILHYTAGELQQAIEVYTDPKERITGHILIAKDGQVFELVKCWDGIAHRAWHAGRSRWSDAKQLIENFNDLSIGIELVNPNGNILAYTDQQYDALKDVIEHLRSLYPALRRPERILGHEHIAGWRGKADPGWMFDWKRLFRLCYPNEAAPLRTPACPAELKTALEKFEHVVPGGPSAAGQFWNAVNGVTETCVRLLQADNDRG
ncbi:MAG: N-acetylmuramoyl-L-alanine amidase [Anaerolineae bacterium]